MNEENCEENCEACGATPPLIATGPWAGQYQLLDFCQYCLAGFCDACFRKDLRCEESPTNVHVADSSDKPITEVP